MIRDISSQSILSARGRGRRVVFVGGSVQARVPAADAGTDPAINGAGRFSGCRTRILVTGKFKKKPSWFGRSWSHVPG